MLSRTDYQRFGATNSGHIERIPIPPRSVTEPTLTPTVIIES
jgi:hypothetical protein